MNSKKSSSSAYMGRVNSDLFRVLTLALRNMNDEKFDEVHILRVEASQDLSSARVYVNNAAVELEKVAGVFRNEIAHSLKIRRVPNLRFIIDDGERNANRVEELLKQIKGEK